MIWARPGCFSSGVAPQQKREVWRRLWFLFLRFLSATLSDSTDLGPRSGFIRFGQEFIQLTATDSSRRTCPRRLFLCFTVLAAHLVHALLIDSFLFGVSSAQGIYGMADKVICQQLFVSTVSTFCSCLPSNLDFSFCHHYISGFSAVDPRNPDHAVSRLPDFFSLRLFALMKR